MNKAQLVEFARLLGLKKVDSTTRAGWVISKCPMARWRHENETDRNPSFGMQVGKDFCSCFSCDWHSDLGTMLYRLAVYSRGNKTAASHIRAADAYLESEGKTVLKIGKPTDEEEDDERDTINEWDEWRISSYLPAYDHPYLETRKGGRVPPDVAAILDFRLDQKRRRLGVPVRDFDGRLMGFHARDVTGKSDLKYLAYTPKQGGGPYNRPIWLGEHLVDFSEPVVMVESVFDMARVLQVWPNVVCPLMASLNKTKVLRMTEARWVVELFDQDKAGQRAVQKLKEGLPDTQFISPGLPDGCKDPGDLDPMVLYYRLKPYLNVHEPAA